MWLSRTLFLLLDFSAIIYFRKFFRILIFILSAVFIFRNCSSFSLQIFMMTKMGDFKEKEEESKMADQASTQKKGDVLLEL